MRLKKLAALVVPVLVLLLALPSPARAWGRLGHRVIAKLAERHLTDRAKAEIKALLEPGESLGKKKGSKKKGSGTKKSYRFLTLLGRPWRFNALEKSVAPCRIIRTPDAAA